MVPFGAILGVSSRKGGRELWGADLRLYTGRDQGRVDRRRQIMDPSSLFYADHVVDQELKDDWNRHREGEVLPGAKLEPPHLLSLVEHATQRFESD